MKRILIMAIVLMLGSLTFGPIPVSAEPCTGTSTKTTDIGEPFGFCWEPNSESDVKHYVIYRDGLIYKPGDVPAIILHSDCVSDRCDSPEYTENIPGSYTFVIVAVDDVDNVSDDSDPITLTIVNLPPSKPTGCSIKL